MSFSASQIPHHLTPYLTLGPGGSLTLVTSVLNATSNWLLLRFLSAALGNTTSISHGDGALSNTHEPAASVVLVSFLREYNFWRDSAKRIQCDIQRATREGRFTYVDGLSKLFSGEPQTHSATSAGLVLHQPDYAAVQKVVAEAVDVTKAKVPGGKTLLVLDGLDLLPATTGQEVEGLLDVIAIWRESAYSTVITAAADLPLLQSPTTPLETAHGAFVTSIAHQARMVISLRLLSTGVAKDVSGVLRATKGPALEDEDGQAVEEKEVLYYVGGDGNVRVFERGS